MKSVKLVLPVFIASYVIAKCIREITRGSVMCRYLTTNELIYDRMNTLYNTKEELGPAIECSQHLKAGRKTQHLSDFIYEWSFRCAGPGKLTRTS